MKPSILLLSRAELESVLEPLGEPHYRARQILSHVWRFVPSFKAMTDLPARLRDHLEQEIRSPGLPIVQVLSEAGEETEKLVFGLEDGARIEAVILENRDRPTTLCVSSQVGCPLACGFCATGRAGFSRNLTIDELVAQVWTLLSRIHSRSEKPSVPNVVFMGMGEPLLNLENLLGAIRILIDPERVGLGDRHVTVSTIGIPRGIRELARIGSGVNLALSLHHPEDDARRRILPRAPASLDEVMAALAEYAELTRRLVTFEYVLLAGVNDSPREAEGVIRRVRGFGHPALVNVIPFNPVEGAPYEAPRPEVVSRFVRALKARGIRTTVRRTQGRSIGAACGQLATAGRPGVAPETPGGR